MKKDTTQRPTSLDGWLKQSTTASGVPLRVRQRAVIAALQMLVGGARRTNAVTRRVGKQSSR